MIETFLEYQVASSLYRELVGAEKQIVAALRARPKDISLTVQLKKVHGDLQALEQIILSLRHPMLHHMETKFNVKFSWLNMLGPSKPVEGLVKMEPST